MVWPIALRSSEVGRLASPCLSARIYFELQANSTTFLSTRPFLVDAGNHWFSPVRNFSCTSAELCKHAQASSLQANSRVAWRNRRRRKHLIERSFADATNNHQ